MIMHYITTAISGFIIFGCLIYAYIPHKRNKNEAEDSLVLLSEEEGMLKDAEAIHSDWKSVGDDLIRAAKYIGNKKAP